MKGATAAAIRSSGGDLRPPQTHRVKPWTIVCTSPSTGLEQKPHGHRPPTEGGMQIIDRIKERGASKGWTVSAACPRRPWRAGLTAALFAERSPTSSRIRSASPAPALRCASKRPRLRARGTRCSTTPSRSSAARKRPCLIYQGPIPSNIEGQVLVDIGGGSTELIIGEGFGAQGATSRKMGCVSFHPELQRQARREGPSTPPCVGSPAASARPIINQYRVGRAARQLGLHPHRARRVAGEEWTDGAASPRRDWSG